MKKGLISGMGQRKQNELEHLRMPEIQEALKKKKKKKWVCPKITRTRQKVLPRAEAAIL